MAAKRRSTSIKRSSASPRELQRGHPVRLERAGLRLDDAGKVVRIPLRAGALHYWRVDRLAWRPALAALAAMELELVETYIPWQVHEREGAPGAPPSYSFEGQLDVAAFLREAHAVGLRAIVRPGPHINAELTEFGLPARVVWDPHCQARSPRGNPVLLPAPPRAFPVPSYASEAFLSASCDWLRVVGKELGELVHPRGPIVMVQIDNEGAQYFRDAAYDQDYHPDSLAIWRGLLKEKYGSVSELRRAYSTTTIDDFDTIAPPLRYDARGPEDLPRHLDWVEAQERTLGRAFTRFRDALVEGGLGGALTFHNFPMGEAATALHASTVRASGIDLVALDYYHQGGDWKSIARRTAELSVVSDALDVPAFAAEMGAGAPPFFPPLDERDAAFTLLCAMAYGIRGYDVYMAVERDRWLGAPIDRDGVMRPFAAFWRKVGAAFDRVRFGDLVRDVPARLVVPRSMRRLARVMHAFGPATQTLFRVFGGGLRETVFEDGIDFGDGTGEAPPVAAGKVLVAAERALDEEGIAHAFVDSSDLEVASHGVRWILAPTTCGLDLDALDALRRASERGVAITFAPSPPRRDGAFQLLSPKTKPLDEAHVLLHDEAIDQGAMRRHLAAFFVDAPRVYVPTDGCAATVHCDREGAPRCIFVINATKERRRVEVAIGGVKEARDLLDGSKLVLAEGVMVEASSVRWAEVTGRGEPPT